MTTQLEALRLADLLDERERDRLDLLPSKAAAELRRLHQHELANQIWHDKTEWVQQTAQPNELGMHRADVLRQRIDRLHAVNAELLESLKSLIDMDVAYQRGPKVEDAVEKARAAIAKAGGAA